MNDGNGTPDDLPRDERLRALYRGLPADEPPAHLDDAVLAAARRAVAAKPRAVPAPWTTRWRFPLAAAASVLLAIVVLYQVPVERSALQEAARDSMNAPVDAGAVATAAPAPAAPAEAQPPPPAVAALEKQRAATPERADAARAKRALAPEQTARANVAGRAADSGALAAAPQPQKEEVAANEPAPAAAMEQEMARAQGALQDRLAEAKDAAGSVAATAPVVAAAPPAAPAPAPAPKAVAPAPTTFALAPRGAPWPFGLVPDLAPNTACARVVQDSGGSCSARLDGNALVLRLEPADPEWLPRLREALDGLGWQAEPAQPAGSARYSRRTVSGLERFEWSTAADGALTLRLAGAGNNR